MNVKDYAFSNGLTESQARRKLEVLVTEGKMKKVYGSYSRGKGTFRGQVKTVDFIEVQQGESK